MDTVLASGPVPWWFYVAVVFGAAAIAFPFIRGRRDNRPPRVEEPRGATITDLGEIGMGVGSSGPDAVDRDRKRRGLTPLVGADRAEYETERAKREKKAKRPLTADEQVELANELADAKKDDDA